MTRIEEIAASPRGLTRSVRRLIKGFSREEWLREKHKCRGNLRSLHFDESPRESAGTENRELRTFRRLADSPARQPADLLFV
jgi:hypothetical protein